MAQLHLLESWVPRRGTCNSCGQDHGTHEQDLLPETECMLRWRVFDKGRNNARTIPAGQECYVCWDERRRHHPGQSQAKVLEDRKSDEDANLAWLDRRRQRCRGQTTYKRSDGVLNPSNPIMREEKKGFAESYVEQLRREGFQHVVAQMRAQTEGVTQRMSEEEAAERCANPVIQPAPTSWSSISISSPPASAVDGHSGWRLPAGKTQQGSLQSLANRKDSLKNAPREPGCDSRGTLAKSLASPGRGRSRSLRLQASGRS